MKKSGSGTTPTHSNPLTYAMILCSRSRWVTLTLSDGKPLPSLSYNCIIQSASLSSVAQKWLRPFILVRNTRLPMCCSMIHCASDPIRFAKRFFAFFEMGVTVASFMISMCFVCVQSSRDCVSRRDCVCHLCDCHISTRLSRLDFHFLRGEL